ncbi:MAG: hypothetical protein ABIC19_02755 [Patescibacteria group bacterium]|nr:hypothetical protein [Patescibacteria group bacterium]
MREIKIAGNLQEQEKKDVQEYLGGCLRENHLENMPTQLREKLTKDETKKSQKEIEAIKIVNQSINQLLDSLQLSNIDIPVRNYHLISKDLERHSKSQGGVPAIVPIGRQ